MVPVKLQLQNFLSYGTEAPTLDFNQFQVACLSGKNGQGKSALLDAMTWALWGEARKSSGKRKPDEELIRIGTRHMEVTFIFDVAGDRYRVTRSFSRSSTGKTTTSDLEFQIYLPETDTYRTLTEGHMRDTQARIEKTLGLDYNTFINSAFLLQGRSDEFTKKRPSERKEILASILNLSKYEELAALARDRWRTAKQVQQQATSEVERLHEQVEDVPDWKAEHEAVSSDVDAKQEALASLRAEEKRLTEKQAELEAQTREAESVQEAIEALDGRIAENQEEAAGLEERIAEAGRLIEQRDAVQAAYERYEALQEERDTLDEKRDLHRGLEKQIEQKKSQVRDRKNELEKKLDRQRLQQKQQKKEAQQCAQKLAQQSMLEEELKKAKAAKKRVAALTEKRDQKQQLDEKLSEVEQQLISQREALRGQLKSLREQIEAKEERLDGAEELAKKVESLEQAVEKRDALVERRQSIRDQGTELTERISERSGQLEVWRQELAKQHAERERFQAVADGVCPTCGSDLTAQHRREVEASFRDAIESLQQDIEAGEAALNEDRAARTDLRETFKEVGRRIEELDGAGEQLATVREQARAQKETKEALASQRKEAKHVEQKLNNKAYGQALRTKHKTLRQKRAALDFDQETFDELKDQAAQRARYQERLQDVEEAAGRKEQLESAMEQREKEMAKLRKKLEDGTAFGTLPDEIERLEAQLEQVGFDPERFDAVRAKLKALSEAGSRMKDLLNAQQNRDDWTEQLERVRTRTAEAKADRAARKETLAALKEALEQKPAIEQKRQAQEAAVEEAEQELNALQQRLGKLSERLKQAERDQEALKQAKKDRDAAKEERALYKHLRRAFGKHGIPSLIIEETLPEIEERANLLLDRLTDGKMHVRLETLKDKKTGGTKETLEIIITDEQGVPRPYETFSGGESFRVNFALRIALAQLLAERSGVRIRTLVIDEGFGTQDADGIERLVEAIHAIQDDFAKIIVITHLERLKQVFPVRIEVEKDPVTGSSFELRGA